MKSAERERKNPAVKSRRSAGRMIAAVFALLLFMILPFCSTDAYADSVEYTSNNTLIYTDDSGIKWNCTKLNYQPTIAINGCDSIDDSGTMTIPEEIDGYMVSDVGSQAFSNNQEVKTKLKKLIMM